MQNKLVINNNNIDFEGYDVNSNTLTIKDVANENLYITFDNYVPDNMKIVIINSQVSIIENYIGKISDCNFYNRD